jgi:hypothetical protein
MDYKHFNNEKELLYYLGKYSEIKNYGKLESVLKNIEELISARNCNFCYYALLKKLPLLKMKVYASSKMIGIFEKRMLSFSEDIQKHNSNLLIKAKRNQLKRKFRNRFNVGKYGPHKAFSSELTHGRGLTAPMQF